MAMYEWQIIEVIADLFETRKTEKRYSGSFVQGTVRLQSFFIGKISNNICFPLLFNDLQKLLFIYYHFNDCKTVLYMISQGLTKEKGIAYLQPISTYNNILPPLDSMGGSQLFHSIGSPSPQTKWSSTSRSFRLIHVSSRLCHIS